jgi:hypothetical protein
MRTSTFRPKEGLRYMSFYTSEYKSDHVTKNKPIGFSIFAQVNITNPTSCIDWFKFDVLRCYITKPKFSKWRLAVLWTLY